MKVVEFLVLWSSEDRYRHRHVRIGGQVVEFVVQYEIRVGLDWVPVARYDTAHGFAHRDLLSPNGGASENAHRDQGSEPRADLCFVRFEGELAVVPATVSGGAP